MPNLSDRLARELIDHQIDLLRYSASVHRDVDALLLQMQEELAEQHQQARINLVMFEATNANQLPKLSGVH